MKRKLIKILTLCMVVCLSLCVFAACSCAKGEDENSINYSEGLDFVLNEEQSGYILTGVGICNDRKIVIPNEYNGKPVVAIGEKAFYQDSYIKVVEIPSTVTTIGTSAFAGCTSLKSITIGEGVTNIDRNAFGGCESLTKVNFTGIIDQWVQIEFNESYSNPLVYAKKLYMKNKLVTDVVLTTAKQIKTAVFLNCQSLRSILIPDSVLNVECAFGACESLIIYCEAKSKPVEWSDDWNLAFRYASARIYDGSCPVVWDCKNNDVANNGYIYTTINNIRYSLKDDIATIIKQSSDLIGNINISSNITYKNKSYCVSSIQSEAFYECEQLESIIIPSSIKSIGDYVFGGSNSLTIYCEAESKPDDWSYYWNYSSRPVVWGYKG